MNVKVQGGGSGSYSNSGSCFGTVSYLKHEDSQRAKQRQDVEPFFNQNGNVSSKNVISKIDNNKVKLSKSDAKFYVMTVSPSASELQKMGKTPEEQSAALKEYVRNDVMQKYAESFKKGLNKDDIMYYAKIHHDRGNKQGENMHCHVIISRKDMSNTKKISPQTNHKTAEKSGTVKSGFNRTEFYSSCEQSFDKRFSYQRDYKESFKYQNTMKNGSIEERKSQIQEAVRKEKEQSKEKNVEQNREQKQEVKRDKGLSL
ncbi:MAG: DUF5712 family protein [Prevotella sp.]|jgi:hypothetical protein|nr:DUF5712 family protein [Prevotella sp.]